MRERAWFNIYRAATAICGVLPLQLASRLGDRCGRLAYHFAGGIRANVGDNLAHVLRLSGSQRPTQHLVRAAFSSYGRYWSELACLAYRGKKLDQIRYELDGRDHLEVALRKGRGVVLALPHIGAWDIAGAIFTTEGAPLTSVAEGAVSSALFDWFVAKRANLGLSVLALSSDSSTRLLQILETGGVIALIADRDVSGDGMPVRFFDAMTTVPSGPAVLALRTGATLLAACAYQGRFGSYRIVVRPPLDTDRRGGFRSDVRRITECLVGEYESFIAEAPEQWHVFQPNWASPTTAAEG